MTIQDFTTKTVPFRFAGTEMKFHLSQALFSSFEVDKGSQLLLKTLAQQWTPPPAEGRIADLGCGVGILGIALGKKWPQLRVEAVDRDALACGFSRLNGDLNGVPLAVRCELGLENPEGDLDLVVSNLPAKAGTPVLTHFLHQMAWRLKEGGRIAVVIVEPLAAWLKTTVEELGGTVHYQEDTPQYRVLHFTLPKKTPALDLDPYLRTEARIKKSGVLYSLHTVYGLPNFDNLDFELELGLGVLKKWEEINGDTLFWNPGQGHLPMVLARKLRKHRVLLAGRDVLALRITQRNLSSAVPLGLETIPASHWSDLNCTGFHQVVVQWEKTPQVKEEESFWTTLNRITGPGARVLILARSHDIQDLIKCKKGWPIIDSPKHRGFRALLLEKAP